MSAVFVVFLHRAEADSEDAEFIAVCASEEVARRVAEANARQDGHAVSTKPPKAPSLGKAGRWRWGLGPEGPRNPNISGDGKEDAAILTDWTDPEESDGYRIEPVRLCGAYSVQIDKFRQWNKGPDFVVSAERRCDAGSIFRAFIVGVEPHPKPPRPRQAARS